MLESVKDACCGCSACFNVCVKNAISMAANNEGFLYPNIDESICVKCGACELACPVLHTSKINKDTLPEAYAVQNKDEKIRMDSTSGGAFTAIARYVLSKGGVVFGAVFNEKFDVVHSYIETDAELSKIRRSKYVQSCIGKTYKQAKTFLDQGRWVCFSGTPCQIAGLKRYLRKDFENLVTIDIACHGVPSPLFWRKYKDYQEKKFASKINFADFRYKKNGYSSSVMALHFENGKTYYHGHESDYMLKAFFAEIVSRKSCYNCNFKSLQRLSDFTIFDCWSIGHFEKSMNDNKGTTTLLIQSSKAAEIWTMISSNFRSKKIPVDTAISLDGNMIVSSVKKNPQRTEFFEDLENEDFESVCKKYFPIKFKDTAKTILKPILYKLGVLKIVNSTRRMIAKKKGL